jgi:4-amino-4-deoxy-L-arabinose transferase-like glycosyltransferase
MDMLLVLTVLLATWAVMLAAESGRQRWLLVGAVVLGLGFNIKMLEAYLVLPAFYLLYLLAAPGAWRRRFVHLGAATVVLLVVSLSWTVAVDLTPADQRPYVGSSSDNTVSSLILRYNGLDRLTGQSDEIKGSGAPGPLRLLNQNYAGQVGWLLPLAIVGLVAASLRGHPRLPLDRRQGALVLWGTWFLTAAAYFSIAGVQHRYYTVMLAPAIAALVGAGVVALWNDYRDSGWDGWSLPLALMVTAFLHARILSGYGDWGPRLTPLIVGLCLISSVVLVVLRTRPKVGAYAALATAVGILALLIAPTVWASYTVFQGPRGPMPLAGPPHPQPLKGHNTQGDTGVGKPGDGLPGGGNSSDSSGSTANPALIDFLQANQGDAKYLVAAFSARSTAPIILSTNEPVISLGGYKGTDPVFTTERITDLVTEGDVRFFLIPDADRKPTLDDNVSQQSDRQDASEGRLRNESARWVHDNCRRILRQQPASTLGQGKESSTKPLALYDCGVRGSR